MSDDAKPIETKPPPTSVTTQIKYSVLGEMIGCAVSIGAVYMAHHVFPKQSNDFIGKLAVKLGEWRGTSPVAQQILARQITDVTVMNIGGLANMGGQFALHRKGFDPKERSTVKSDFGRVITGRVAGTATAIGMVAIAKTLGPQAMNRSEQALSSLMGNNAKSDRFVELFISNAIQSVGGIAGNVPAQLLYDKLVDHGPSPQR